MDYRRALIPGGTWFFTINLANRSSRLLIERVDTLREVVRAVRQRHPFEIVAWVVLPDHIHAIWTLPPDDADFPTRWALIKAGFSRRIAPGENINVARATKGERGIWQRRFWEHLIRDEDDLARHVDYIHINPVKHGHAVKASDWSWSSIHRYIRNGVVTEDWATDPDVPASIGERQG